MYSRVLFKCASNYIYLYITHLELYIINIYNKCIYNKYCYNYDDIYSIIKTTSNKRINNKEVKLTESKREILHSFILFAIIVKLIKEYFLKK